MTSSQAGRHGERLGKREQRGTVAGEPEHHALTVRVGEELARQVWGGSARDKTGKRMVWDCRLLSSVSEFCPFVESNLQSRYHRPVPMHPITELLPP